MPIESKKSIKDIDLIVRTADLAMFTAILAQNGFSRSSGGSHIFLKKRYGNANLVYDVHTKLKIGLQGRYHTGSQLDSLIVIAEEKGGFFSLPAPYEAALLLLRLSNMKNFASPYVQRIRCFGVENLTSLPELEELRDYIVDAWSEMESYWYTKKTLFLKVVIFYRRLLFLGGRIVKAASIIRNYLRCIKYGVKNMVLFLGPDGSGKTTLSHLLGEQTFPTPVWYSVSRPPDTWGLNNRARIIQVKLRHRKDLSKQGSLKRKGLWVAISVVNYLSQHLLLARILYTHRGDSRLIVIDRYPWDLLATPGMTNWPIGFSKLFVFRLFPKPGFVVLCIGDPGKIFERKQDLSINQIQGTIVTYGTILSKLNIPNVEVNTTAESIEINLFNVARSLEAHYKIRIGNKSPSTDKID